MTTIYVKPGDVVTDAYDLSTDQFELSGTTLQIKSTALNFLSGGDQEVTYAADPTVDFSVAATRWITLGGNPNITLSNLVNGGVYRLKLIQAGTGSRTVTWVTTIKWAGKVAPTLTTTIGGYDWITFVKSNNIIDGAATFNFG